MNPSRVFAVCIFCQIVRISSSSSSTGINSNTEIEYDEPLVNQTVRPRPDVPKYKIGIIGGGIGGTATAYFLKSLFEEDALLYLYEPGKIGGRLSSSSNFNWEYEMGGTIIHPQNQYINNFIAELGLEKNSGCQSKAGIFDGEEYAFVESEWNIINIIKAFIRYGFDLYWLQKDNGGMLKAFSKIYDHQKEGLTFKSVEDLLYSLDSTFPKLVKKSLRSFLKENEFHDLIIDEFVAACTRANYGQSPNIHAFVGSVSIAGATPGLWSVVGGNKRVPEQLLKHSEALMLRQRVTKIFQMQDGTFRVWSEANVKEGENEVSREFDAIVLAAPLTTDNSNIQFVNFPERFEFPGRYERIVCTLVQGELNETTFKFNEIGVRVDEILTDNPALNYNSVGKQYPVNSDNRCSDTNPRVFKVFSPQILTETQLSFLFDNYTKTEVIDWLAYPHYDAAESLGHFELVPGLYYNNAIEKAASAMEMSVIAAKNSALLINKYLKGNDLKQSIGKEEL